MSTNRALSRITAGTVNVTNGNRTVTGVGVGAAWRSVVTNQGVEEFNDAVGYGFLFFTRDGNGVPITAPAMIDELVDANTIRLVTPYAGPTATGLAYDITVPGPVAQSIANETVRRAADIAGPNRPFGQALWQGGGRRGALGFANDGTLTISTGAVTSNYDALTARTLVNADGTVPWIGVEGGRLAQSLVLRPEATGAQAFLQFYRPNNTIHWQMGRQRDVGSGQFEIARFDAAGDFVDAPMVINATTGVMALSARPSFNGATPWDSGNFNPAGLYASSGGVLTGDVLLPGVLNGAFGYLIWRDWGTTNDRAKWGIDRATGRFVLDVFNGASFLGRALDINLSDRVVRANGGIVLAAAEVGGERVVTLPSPAANARGLFVFQANNGAVRWDQGCEVDGRWTLAQRNLVSPFDFQTLISAQRGRVDFANDKTAAVDGAGRGELWVRASNTDGGSLKFVNPPASRTDAEVFHNLSAAELLFNVRPSGGNLAARAAIRADGTMWVEQYGNLHDYFVRRDQFLAPTNPVRFPAYNLVDLPPAGQWDRAIAFCNNPPSGGGQHVVSDGTNWRSLQDRSVVVRVG